MLFRLSKEHPDSSRINVTALDLQAKDLLRLAGHVRPFFTVNHNVDVSNNVSKAVFYIYTYIESYWPVEKRKLLKIMVDL